MNADRDALAALRARFPAGIALLDSVSLIRAGGGNVDVMAQRPFRISGMRPPALQTLADLKRGCRWDALEAALQDDRCSAILCELDRRGLLAELLPAKREQTPQESQLRWLSHFLPSGAAAQEELERQSAMIIGCGGTGSLVVQHLGGMGLRRLSLVDYDAVEPTNFNRQFPFRRSDLGRPKVEALREYLGERYPECDVTCHPVRVGSAEDILRLAADVRPTVLFGCADTPVGFIGRMIAEASLALGVPCVFGNVGLMDGTVGPLLHDEAPLRSFIREMDELGRRAERAIGRIAMRASFAPVNTMIAAFMVHEWACYTLGLGGGRATNRTLIFDLQAGQIYGEKEWG